MLSLVVERRLRFVPFLINHHLLGFQVMSCFRARLASLSLDFSLSFRRMELNRLRLGWNLSSLTLRSTHLLPICLLLSDHWDLVRCGASSSFRLASNQGVLIRLHWILMQFVVTYCTWVMSFKTVWWVIRLHLLTTLHNRLYSFLIFLLFFLVCLILIFKFKIVILIGRWFLIFHSLPRLVGYEVYRQITCCFADWCCGIAGLWNGVSHVFIMLFSLARLETYTGFVAAW